MTPKKLSNRAFARLCSATLRRFVLDGVNVWFERMGHQVNPWRHCSERECVSECRLCGMQVFARLEIRNGFIKGGMAGSWHELKECTGAHNRAAPAATPRAVKAVAHEDHEERVEEKP